MLEAAVLVCLLLVCGGHAAPAQNHKLEKRQTELSCFSEIVSFDGDSFCTGERLAVMTTLEECCQPRSIGGLEGGCYAVRGGIESPCPSNISTDVEIRCHSGESCDSESFSVVPDIQSCCLLEGERSFSVERPSGIPGQCRQCVVVQWVDSPERTLGEQSAGHVLTVEYTKGEVIGFTDSALRAELRLLSADVNDVILNDPNVNLNGGDSSVVVAVRPDSVALEIAETFQLVLVPRGQLAPNEILLDTIDLTIIDNDDAEILLTELDYRLNPENAGLLTVIVEVRNDISTPVSLQLTPYDFGFVRTAIADGQLVVDNAIRDEIRQIEDRDRPSEATSVADFDDSPILFEVDASGDYRVGIPISADEIYEAEQRFVVVLELANQSFSGLVNIDQSRNAAICRIIDDDSISLTWEQPVYTFMEGINDQSSLDGFFAPPTIIKQNGTITEYLLEIYTQPLSLFNDSRFIAEWRNPMLNIDNDFAIGTSQPGVVRFIFSDAPTDEIVIDIFSDNVFNEGVEVAGLNFVNSLNRPLFMFGVNPVAEIVILDRNLSVGFNREVTTISEGVGSFELCVMIFIPELNSLRGPFEIANAFTLQLLSINGTAGDSLDYVDITEADDPLVPFETNSSTHVQCFNVTIIDDSEFENTEDFSFTLSLEGSPFQSVIVEPSVSVVEIVDNDAVRIGFEVTEYTVNESDGEVTLVVSILEGASSTPVTLLLTTINGTATIGADFNLTEIVLSLDDNNDSVNITVPISDDSVVEGNEQFTAVLTLLGPMEFSDRITIQPDTALVSILDSSTSENVTRVNDTIIGDPLFTVPLRVTNLLELGLEQDLSLCYEVHGDTGRHFNLVSDICTSVSAHYTNISIFNVIDSIAVRAVDEEGACHNILVSVEDSCSASVDGVLVETAYSRNGISVRRYPGSRVRVSVPNCAHLSLVMWVFCQNSTLRAYDSEDNLVLASATIMKFVIARGFNLQERSHGLIGQFWNIPITIALFNETLPDFYPDETYYSVTVSHPDSSTRTFIAFYYPRSWEVVRGQNNPCLYAGGQQADNTDSSDSVIQGLYTDYVVDAPFDTDYQYSKFESNRCTV